VVASDEYERKGINLLSEAGFEEDKIANSVLRALSAKIGLAVESYSDAELGIAMHAYDAGIQHAEMIAYREKPGRAGAPPKVPPDVVDAAYQRFVAKAGNASSTPTCVMLGKAPYWQHKHKLTYQHYRKWRLWRKTRLGNSPE
jgi:hypothetical protein